MESPTSILFSALLAKPCTATLLLPRDCSLQPNQSTTNPTPVKPFKMANKYEKFDNEFGLLPAEHENVNISKQKNGGLRSASTTLGTNHLRDHFSDDKCAVEILTPITNCNGNKHLAGEPQSSTGASGAARPPASNFSEFDANNLPKLSFHQQKWRFYLENTWYRLVSIGLIIIYCFLMLYRFAMMLSDPLLDEYFIPIGDFDALLIIYFTVELFFRVYASGYVPRLLQFAFVCRSVWQN